MSNKCIATSILRKDHLHHHLGDNDEMEMMSFKINNIKIFTVNAVMEN